MRIFIFTALILALVAVGVWVWLASPGEVAVGAHSSAHEAPARAPLATTEVTREEPSQTVAVSSSVVPGIPASRPAPAPPTDVAPAAGARGTMVPPGPRTEAAADLENVQLMLRDFRTRIGENPVGSNAEIMQAVMGANPARARLGPPEGQSLNATGELVDRWGTAYFFHQLSGKQMEIRSAGPDQRLWTQDDLVAR